MKKTIVPVIIATAWIGFNEFVRNELLLKTYWTDHYSALGLDFPDDMINNAVWGIWGLLLATGIYILSTQFSLLHTTFLAWSFGFVLMWVVIGNMAVLPFGVLPFAIPWSLFEVFIAAWIMEKMKKKPA